MNEILNRFFERITGKRLIEKLWPQGLRNQDAREQLGYLQKERHDEMKRQKAQQQQELDREMRAEEKSEKKEANQRRLNILTTNDLDENRKLIPGYLKLRAKRKKKEEKSESFGWSRDDWR